MIGLSIKLAIAAFFLLPSYTALAQMPDIQIQAVVIDPQGGAAPSGMQHEGGVDDIFSAQKQMVTHVLQNMGVDPNGLPEDVQRDLSTPHTNSLPALMHFSEGIDALDQGNFADARESFDQAVQEDPSFEMATEMRDVMPRFNAPAPAPASEGQEAPVPAAEENGDTEENGGEEGSESAEEETPTLSAIVLSESEPVVEEATEEVLEAGSEEDVAALGGALLSVQPVQQTFAALAEPVSTGDDLVSGEEALLETSETGDLTQSQETVDNYIAAEDQDLVSGDTFSGTTTVAPKKALAVLAAYLLHEDSSTWYLNQEPFISTAGTPLEENGTTGGGHIDFNPLTTVQINQKNLSGFLKYEPDGAGETNLVAFREDVSVPSPTTHKHPALTQAPPSGTDRLDQLDLAGDAGFVRTEFMSEGSWASDLGIAYQYATGGLRMSMGTPVPLQDLTDLATNNASHSYSGNAYGEIVKGSFGIVTNPATDVEVMTGTFSADVDFGTGDVSNLHVAATSSNYELDALQNAPVGLGSDGTFFIENSDMTTQIGNLGAMLSSGQSESYVAGAVHGKGAMGMAGVVAASGSNGTTEDYHATVGFIGNR